MFVKVETQAVIGIEAFPVDVEVDISGGLPHFAIVGLPDVAVKEARDRVKAAIKNSGFELPARRITVNLAPAEMRKEGSGFDLAIAVGILSAVSAFPSHQLVGKIFCGELSLDGGLRPIPGILPRVLKLRGMNDHSLIIPQGNGAEAGLVDHVTVWAARHLGEVIAFVKGEGRLQQVPCRLQELWNRRRKYACDFSEVKGQEAIKRGIEVAATGGHNLLMIGPPGAGKTMLAQRIPTILTELSLDESIETTKIHSVAGLLAQEVSLITTRPFRAPHHTISDAALIGGGKIPRPGEMSLAHHGVLFLDELPEFKRNVLEALRQPLEEGRVRIDRAIQSVSYPAQFMLVAAMNPCPCGFRTDPKRPCHCQPPEIQRYLAKISGPLLDRIDIHLEVPPVTYRDLTATQEAEASSAIRGRVAHARQRQGERYRGSEIRCNAHLTPREIPQHCLLTSEAQSLLQRTLREFSFSARAYHRILKIARTIADLAGQEEIGCEPIAEAIGYRTLDRTFWAA